MLTRYLSRRLSPANSKLTTRTEKRKPLLRRHCYSAKLYTQLQKGRNKIMHIAGLAQAFHLE